MKGIGPSLPYLAWPGPGRVRSQSHSLSLWLMAIGLAMGHGHERSSWAWEGYLLASSSMIWQTRWVALSLAAWALCSDIDFKVATSRIEAIKS